MQQKEYKILIGLREIAGYCGNLKTGFDKIGVEAHFLNLGGNRFYQQHNNPTWINFFNFIGTKIGSLFSKNFLLRFIWLAIFQNAFGAIAFCIAVFKYDAFVFVANSTFFYFLELPILGLLGKKIIYVFLGSDSRPIYMNGYVMNSNENTKLNVLLTWLQKRVVTYIEYFADVCVNHPPQAYFHEKDFVSLLCIGLPVNLPASENYIAHNINRGKIKILHAPSKAGPKGSAVFKNIIERLKAKGHAIDYIEISGVSNTEVFRMIQTCDFVLDELYSDTPMAVFASEAASFGKPAVVGSYYTTDLLKDIPNQFVPPSCFTQPENMEAAIEKMIVDVDYRNKLGKAAKEFIDKNWRAEIVAERFMFLIKGKVSGEWIYHPSSLNYVHGCGLSEANAKSNIRAFIGKKGIDSLCLKDKPVLEKKLKEFAFS